MLAGNFSGVHEETQTIGVKFIFRSFSVHAPSAIFNQNNWSNFEMKRTKTSIENIYHLSIFSCVRCPHNPVKIVTVCIQTNKMHKVLVSRLYFLVDALHVSDYISPSSAFVICRYHTSGCCVAIAPEQPVVSAYILLVHIHIVGWVTVHTKSNCC